MGVIDAYRLVKEEVPEVQLALVGSMATDDPEGWEFFNQTMAYADGDPDIHILNNLNNVGAIEVNAFQSQADVVIQKSTREGFGLTVSEALWKARPFIGGDVGGIPLQVQDGETGYLVSSPEECAERALGILREPDLGKRLGRAGKEHVRKHFLTPAPAARLAAYLPRADELRHPARPRLEPRPGHVRAGRGRRARPARGGGGLVTALTGLVHHRDALWIASTMSDEDAEASREHGGGGFDCELDGRTYRIRLVESDPDAYDRFYNVVANPMLWFIQHYLWDLSNAPDIRPGGRRLRGGLLRGEPRPRATPCSRRSRASRAPW